MIEELTLALPGDSRAPGLARQFVVEHGATADLAADLLDDAYLLTSELVGNAVQHGRPAITLVLRTFAAGVEVRVHDEGTAFDVARLALSPSHQTSGRGLHLVAALATAWGLTPSSPAAGKTVWFDL